jgi:hypothetical protein
MTHKALLLSIAILSVPGVVFAQSRCGIFDLLKDPKIPAELKVTGLAPYEGQSLVARKIIFEENAVLTFNNDAWQEVQIVADSIEFGPGVTISSTARGFNGEDGSGKGRDGSPGSWGSPNGQVGGAGAGGSDGGTLNRLNVVLASKSMSFAATGPHPLVDLSGFPGGNGGHGTDGGTGGDGIRGLDSQRGIDPVSHEEYCKFAGTSSGNGADSGPGGVGGAAGAGGNGGTMALVGAKSLAAAKPLIDLRNSGGKAGTPGAGGYEGDGGYPGEPAPQVISPCEPIPAAKFGHPLRDEPHRQAHSGDEASDGNAAGDIGLEVCFPDL